MSDAADDRALRAAVVGLGWAGQQHAAAYAAQPGVELVALAGMEEPVLAAVGARYGVERLARRWEDVLDVEGLDVLSVATPTYLHAPIAVAALERGVHVLSEKPMARTGAEAGAMVRAARRAGRVLDVAFNHRRRGDVRKLAEVVGSGRLGRPYYAKGWWLRRAGIPTVGSWFTQAELAGGGALVDIGVHVLDFALSVLGRPRVTAVSATTHDLLGQAGFGSNPASRKTGGGGSTAFEVEDLASAFLRLEGGAALLVEASWAAHRADGDEFGLTLYGTEGGAELRVADYAPSGSLVLFADDAGVAAQTRLAAPPGRGHDEVVEEFLAKVRAGDPGAHDGAAPAELARIVDACYLSAAEQREVTL